MNTENQKSNNGVKWLIDTLIEGILFFLPIFIFLTIIRKKDMDRSFEGYDNPMWFSETNLALIFSFLFFFIAVFLVYYFVKYKQIDIFSIISAGAISGLIILITTYCLGETQLYDHGGEINYSILPYSFFIYSFFIIEATWVILSYKRNTIKKFLENI